MSGDYHTVMMNDLSTKDRYFLMTGCIVPRPIAWVTSFNRDRSVLNLAPFSYFNGVSSKPPLIMLGLSAKKDGNELVNKDTTQNIIDTEEFVIHIPQSHQSGLVEESSKPFPHGESEVGNLDLETIESTMVKVPGLKIGAIRLECRLYQAIPIEPLNSHMILGEVLVTHIHHELWKDGRIDTESLDPLARLDAGKYGSIGERF